MGLGYFHNFYKENSKKKNDIIPENLNIKSLSENVKSQFKVFHCSNKDSNNDTSTYKSDTILKPSMSLLERIFVSYDFLTANSDSPCQI